ncbi:dihydrodipicolinate synthase family protein [Arenibacterium sp. CAU 1754]
MDGIIAAVPTPVDADGAPIRDLFLEHCTWALGNGCDGLNILGSTGEANSHDMETRKRVMRWAAEGLERARLMVGTGTPSLAETVLLTEHADDLGYPVALVLPPYYYKPLSDDGLYHWYKSVNDRLGRRKIRIYFYNYPQMTGLVIPVSVIARLHADFPDRFCGIKDSSGDLDYCRTIASQMPDLRVFPSSETTLGEAARAGFAGCISATVNVSAPLCGAIWTGRAAPDPGMLDRAGIIRSAIAAQPLVPAIKHMVARRTGCEDWGRVLPPFVALDAQGQTALSTLDPVV